MSCQDLILNVPKMDFIFPPKWLPLVISVFIYGGNILCNGGALVYSKSC